jgi:hypothetical protein
MTNSTDKNNAQPIHTRYIELHKTLLDVNNKIKNLKQIEPKISQERYEKFISEYEDVVNQTQPQIDEAKSQLELLIAEKSGSYKQVVKEMNEKSSQIEEANRLYEAGLIEKNEFDTETKPLKNRYKELESTHQDMRKEISSLKDALINPLGDKIIEAPDAPAVEAPAPAGSQKEIAQEAVIDVSKPTASFFQRFATFFVISQILAIVLLGTCKILIVAGTLKVILIAYSILLLISVILMLTYLFFGTRARTFSYIIVAAMYFIVGAFLAANLSPEILKSGAFIKDLYVNLDYLHVETFSTNKLLAIWSGWNMYMGAIIFVLSMIRIFLIGLKADYSKRVR